MKRVFFLCLILIGVGNVFFLTTSAQQLQRLELYYGEECPHCHNEIAWFPELLELYPELQIEKYEVWHNAKNLQKFNGRLKELGRRFEGVPTNIIQDSLVIGFDPVGILTALEEHYGLPTKEVDKASLEAKWKKYLAYSWPAMSFILGLVDGFNPCAMWSLVVLISFLLTLEDKKKRWLIGSVFILTSAVIYFGALLAYLVGFDALFGFVQGGVMQWLLRIVGILAIGAGSTSVWAGMQGDTTCKTGDLSAKQRFREKMNAILEREQIWLVLAGVTGLAFAVNSIELLCSIAIPTAFTGTLVGTEMPLWKSITAITIYDIAYMLDDIIVFCVAMWTLSIKTFSHRATQISHLIGGTVLLLLGILLLWNPKILSLLG